MKNIKIDNKDIDFITFSKKKYLILRHLLLKPLMFTLNFVN